MKKKFKDTLDYVQPSKYIVKSEQYSNKFSIPVLTAGSSFILGYTNETDGVYMASKHNPIILFDDFTTAIQWVDFPFKVKSSACKILIPKFNENIKYLYYAIKATKFDNSQHKRYWISEFSNIEYNDFGTKNNEIVNQLDIINEKINTKKKELLLFDKLIKSRFIEMFGDRFSYNKIKLSKICTPIIGLTYKPENVSDDGTIVLRSGNVQNNELQIIDDVIRVTNVKIPENKFIQNNDILMCSRNGSAKLVGKSCLIKQSLETMTFGAFMMVIRSKYPYFLQSFFCSEYFKDQLTGTATASVNQITTKMLNNYEVIEPTINEENEFSNFVKQVDKLKFVDYSKYFLCDIFTLFSSTIAYSSVVSILACPNIFCTCSIGMPLSIAFVANVRRNLCGCIFIFSFLPIFLKAISIPLISNLLNGLNKLTNKAFSLSFLDDRYCLISSFVRASKYTFLCLLPLPITMHSFASKSKSDLLSFTISPTLMPVENKKSIITKSLKQAVF